MKGIPSWPVGRGLGVCSKGVLKQPQTPRNHRSGRCKWAMSLGPKITLDWSFESRRDRESTWCWRAEFVPSWKKHGFLGCFFGGFGESQTAPITTNYYFAFFLKLGKNLLQADITRQTYYKWCCIDSDLPWIPIRTKIHPTKTKSKWQKTKVHSHGQPSGPRAF